jgi:WD40 repeat protein/serine/threonine protein kinase
VNDFAFAFWAGISFSILEHAAQLMNELTEREVAIFIAARRLSASERAAYLDEACAGDFALHRRLDELLGVDEAAGEFLERPADGKLRVTAMPDSPDRPPVPAPEKPGDRIGSYKLLQQIGEGGCGVVYMAEQEAPIRRRVALKVIKLGMDTRQVIARFQAERQALALMDHTNIARVLDAGTTGTGRPYFIMELVHGIKITEFCDENLLTTRQRLEMFIHVCQAVQHAHQKGIIHRDLKPSNILVTVNDGVPVPKVIDFGIAKATQGRLTDQTLFTAFGQFMGTPAYMSPEQAVMTGVDIDTRSDVYSLGVLLYELLAGATPFETNELLASGVDAMRKTISEKEPIRPSTRLAMLRGEALTTTAKRRSCDVPKLLHLLTGDLDWIVMKCLEKDRTRRYETANGLAMDLKRHLNNESIIARPQSTAYKLQKSWQRHKLAIIAMLAVSVVLVVGIAVSTWLAISANRARNSEREQRLAAQAERDNAQAARTKADEARLAEKAEQAQADKLLYVANMDLAQQAWDQNNFGRLRQLLEDTQDFPVRSFEWYYWQRQSHLALNTLQGHLQYVKCVSFSPDGQRIVTGADDGYIKVWDSATGNELQSFAGQGGPILSVAFSPDGQQIVTGGDDGAQVWEVAGGRQLSNFKVLRDHVMSVAFSPDGQRIVTGSQDKTAKVLEASSGKELLTLPGHTDAITSVAFSPNGQWIIAGSADSTAKLWDAASGKELLTLTGHTDAITSVAFSPNGQWIVTGSWDQTAKVWEVLSGKELLTLPGHTDAITSVAFSPNGQRIVTGSWDQTAKVWDAATGQELFSLRGHSGHVDSVAFSPDGQKIVTGSWDKTAKVWEAASSREMLQLKGQSGDFASMAFSPEGRRIVTGGADGMANVWEVASGKRLLTFPGHGKSISSVAFSPDGQQIVTGSSDGMAKVWDSASGRLLYPLKGHTGPIESVAYSPDGQRIATGGDNGAEVWETASGHVLFPLKGHSDRVLSVAFSPDSQRIVSGSWDKTAKVWEAASGRELFTLQGHNNTIWAVAFSPDGQQIVTGSADGTAKVWDSASGRELLTFKGHSGEIRSVAFSPDGQRIVTGGADKTAKVWEPATGRELLTLKGHSNWILSVAFSPDGQRIATGSVDNIAKVWEAAGTNQVVAWQDEERASAQILAARQRERTAEEEHLQMVRTRDSIKQWLILAPVSLTSGQSGAEGLDIEQIKGEGRLRPKAGETISIAGREYKWRPAVLENFLIAFNDILGQVTEHSVAYAICYLRSENMQQGVQMLVGSDDESKVYLNGTEIYKSLDTRICVPEQDKILGITLKAGLNVLVFKVVNEEGGWGGTIRLVDAQGNPLQGVKVTLDPETGASP